MRRLVPLLLVLLAAVVLVPRRSPTPELDGVGPASGGVAGRRVAQGGTIDIDSVRAARALARRRIAELDTYVPAMLRASDSVLKRWPDRRAEPVSVYLPASDMRGYTPAHRQAIVDALTRWQRASAIPVTFRLVRDSAAAEVKVVWIEQFGIRRTGQADMVWNGLGWLVRGRLTMATHSPDSVPLTPEETYTVALHEIGHLLGLGHSDDPADLMYPSTTIHDLTLRDKRTANLLYALPPGSLRDPPTER
jgi:hypothetical protein